MKSTSLRALLFALSAGTLFACSPDDDGTALPAPTPTPATTYASAAAALASVAAMPDTVSVNAAAGGSFRIGRCRLIVPPGAFRTAAGGPVSGTVQVSLMPLLTPADMVFRRILPVSNGQPLVSAGEFRLAAWQGGTALRLRADAPLQIRAPLDGASGAGMLFFQGEMVTDAGPNVVDWNVRERDSSGLAPAVIIDGDTVGIFTDSTGLINADRFMAVPDYQTFTVQVTGVAGLDAANTYGYALYVTENGAWPLLNFTASSSAFAEDHVPSFPVHFVVMAVKDGKFYGGIKSATPTTGSTYTVTLSEVTPTAFKAQVAAL